MSDTKKKVNLRKKDIQDLEPMEIVVFRANNSDDNRVFIYFHFE